jgi:CRISPR-associated protein Csd1
MKEEDYNVGLDEGRKTIDYLYGRLLGIADEIETTALNMAKEKRATNAIRLMQRFSEHPYSTWPILEKKIQPYMARIRHSRYPSLLNGYVEVLEDVCHLIEVLKFIDDKQLKGEFLLAFHCQRRWFKEHSYKKGKWVLKESKSDDAQDDEETED